MVSRRYRLFLWAGPLILLSWLSLAFLDPDPRGNIFETLALGYFLGSLFAHATLAAAWAAFGPGSFFWRVPLSLVWVSLLPVAIAINVGVNGGPADAAVVVGACLLGQWLILQLPLWGLALGFNLRLREADEAEQGFDPRQWQFGIRQLIIITAIVSVMFGIGRLIVPYALGIAHGELPILMFLAIAAVVLTLPLLLAALMRNMALPGVLLVLVLIALASAVELPLLKSFHSDAGPGIMSFVAINAFTAATILTIAMVVRCNGLYLGRRRAGVDVG